MQKRRGLTMRCSRQSPSYMKLNQIVRWPFLLLFLAAVALIGAAFFERRRHEAEDKRREQEYREFQKRLHDAPILDLEALKGTRAIDLESQR